ncbi:MAG: hypothetical protein GQF41_1088 [Candidatus Rifleibacterium amylolyticum]|nr:MAG: hypothetical protein GQF41_1088 [Candidatus Rifleibacterium amylolyticum]
MLLNISTTRNDYNGFNDIARLADATKNLLIDSVELDFSECSFFEANMSAPLYTVISRLFDNLNDVSIINVAPGTQTILRKNCFLKIFGVESQNDNNQTTLPFKIFKMHAGGQFSEYLDRYMRGRGIPAMTGALRKRFMQSLFEIFQNAAIHSRSEHGIFVCGQFYPNKHRLNFTIADAGIGIRENVRNYTRSNMSSCQAIKWAMTEGNTTKTGGQPGGLGLKLIKDFVRINGGKLQIVSHYGFYEFSAENECLQRLSYVLPGTCVNIEINTNDTNTYDLGTGLTVQDIF